MGLLDEVIGAALKSRAGSRSICAKSIGSRSTRSGSILPDCGSPDQALGVSCSSGVGW